MKIKEFREYGACITHIQISNFDSRRNGNSAKVIKRKKKLTTLCLNLKMRVIIVFVVTFVVDFVFAIRVELLSWDGTDC